jgi:signal peptidase I
MAKKEHEISGPKDGAMSRRDARKAHHLLKHGRKWLWIHRDTVSAAQVESCSTALKKLEDAMATGSKPRVSAATDEAEKVFQSVRPRTKWSGWRENFEAIFVALVIAGAVRTYFVQPFKIPTGSMQPTLYGTFPSPYEKPTPYENGEKPNALGRFFGGIILGKTYYENGYRFSGDRIFVDRFTCNFVRPKRGDVIVFRTRNMREKPPQQGADFYIKRLVGLGGEKLQIRRGELVINGETVYTPKVFEAIYAKPIAEGANLKGYVTIEELGRYDFEKRRQRHEVEIFSSDDVAQIPNGHIFVLGDNTANSTDSRYWGTIPRRDIIGRAFLIYWPWSPRTGLIR